jgi:protein-L-isoaspartate(D-aspartate) O-methyltransferase
MTDVMTDPARARAVRHALVDMLVADGVIVSPLVEAAFRTVPLHLFAPEVVPDAITAASRGRSRFRWGGDPGARRHRGSGGVAMAVAGVEHGEHAATSSVSAAQIAARMLEQAGVGRGMRCLHVGSGGYTGGYTGGHTGGYTAGCTAALLAEVVGETGEVTIVDVDPDVVDRTRRPLATTGYDRVHAVVGDPQSGWAARAPL